MAFQFLNRQARPPSSATEIAERFRAHGDWWMTDAERLALTGLLSELRPQCAIEVGVYHAGSLSALARFCKKVYALDIDPACETAYRDRFPNVEFVTGDSSRTLPEVLGRIAENGEPLGFVLIDADHSREGVRRDINNLLRYRPTQPLFVLLHDSFNPECRRGIRDADWAENPNVHLVELDFVPGRFVTEEEGNSQREMWCGFALAVLLPERRVGDVVFHENESLLHQVALRHSVYGNRRWWNPVYAVRELKRRAKQWLQRTMPASYNALQQKRRHTNF